MIKSKISFLTKNLIKSNLNFRFSNINLRKFATEFSKTENVEKKEKEKESSSNLGNLQLIYDLDLTKLKENIKDSEKQINNGTFILPKHPQSSYMGESLIYISPLGLFSKLKNIELPGALSISAVTAMNYMGVLFANYYVFPYFMVLTIVSWYRYISQKYINKRNIYQVTLLNENQVKIYYWNGKQEVLNIKDIFINPDYIDKIALLEKKAGLNRTIFIPLRIKMDNYGVIYLKYGGFNAKEKSQSTLSYCELDLLLGLFNKKTKKIALAANNINI